MRRNGRMLQVAIWEVDVEVNVSDGIRRNPWKLGKSWRINDNIDVVIYGGNVE